jgi:hypothetical protein
MKRTVVVMIGICIIGGSLYHAADKARRKRTRSPALKVGQDAPDFELAYLKDALKIEAAEKTAAEKGEKVDWSKLPKKVKLSGFRGSKPVYLIFSSYT